MTARTGCLVCLVLVAGLQVWCAYQVDKAHPVPEYDEAVYSDLVRMSERTGAPLRRLGSEPRFYYIHPQMQTWIWGLANPFQELHENVDEKVSVVDASLAGVRSLRWIVTAQSCLTMCAVCWLGYQLGGWWCGALAVMVLGLNPLWLRYQHLVYLEVPVGFWMSWSLAVLTLVITHPERRMFAAWFLAGGFVGAACTTKYTALPIVAAAMAAWLVKIWQQKRGVWAAGLCVSLGLVAVAVWWPWSIWTEGSLSEWWQRSWGRWSSFQVGQGGDPRTEWGVLQLVLETLGEFGLVHTVVLLVGIYQALLCGCAMLCRPVGNGGTRIWFWKLVPTFVLVGTGTTLWFLAPTKDPKFVVALLPGVAALVGWGAGVAFHRIACWARTKARKIAVAGFVMVGTILAFPTDLLGLDGTRWRFLYPTDHAFTHTCLDHGQEYVQAAQSLEQLEQDMSKMIVGRQGPILAFLLDRAYYLSYTYRDWNSVAELIADGDIFVQDDRWDLCFAGLDALGQKAATEWIKDNYSVVGTAGRIVIWQNQMD